MTPYSQCVAEGHVGLSETPLPEVRELCTRCGIQRKLQLNGKLDYQFPPKP